MLLVIAFSVGEMFEFEMVLTDFEVIEGDDKRCFFVENSRSDQESTVKWLENFFGKNKIATVNVEFPPEFFSLRNTSRILEPHILDKFNNQNCVVLVTGYDFHTLKKVPKLRQPKHHLLAQSIVESMGNKISGKQLFIFLINLDTEAQREIIQYRLEHYSSQFSLDLPPFR